MAGTDSLYELLPAVYRERDAERGKPLEALLRIVQGQADLVEDDIRRLWESFFVVTAQPWAVPYLGDLVGTTPLFDASRVRQPDTARDLFPDLVGPSLRPPLTLRNRADVAKTLYYRRRKGTLPMLEELARDVTGWAAHAVEFFELLGWAQCVRNHLRMHSLRTPDLRHIEPLDRLDGPFDEIAHTVDVRPIDPLDGWHNIKNIGFFLWRLRSHGLKKIAARRALAGKYHFSPLGNPAPLFSRPRREGDEAGLATELHVPGPIRPLAFWKKVDAFYGPFDTGDGSSLEIRVNRLNKPPFQVPPSLILAADLGTGNWKRPSSPLNKNKVAVDVRRGRLALGTSWRQVTSVDVWYHHGFSADLGGGSYPRGAWMVRKPSRVILVDQSGATAGSVKDLTTALARWNETEDTVIRILDNRTYEEDLAINKAGLPLAIEAADRVRPHLKGRITIGGPASGGSLTLSGLLVEGWIHVERPLQRLRLLHTTLVPGRGLGKEGNPAGSDPSLVCKDLLDYKDLRVELAFSITGPLRLPEGAAGLWVLDSIVDGVGTDAITGLSVLSGLSAPPSWLERVTILGPSSFKELTLASEVIFTQPVAAERLQEGCVRFSHLPPGSKTPRGYRCQPDLEIAVRTEQAGRPLTSAEKNEIRAGLVPSFTDTRYGQPAYAQLHLACPKQIRTGAEDGSEMGAFCHLKQPQREANLRLRLNEYLPFGLEPGILYVT